MMDETDDLFFSSPTSSPTRQRSPHLHLNLDNDNQIEPTTEQSELSPTILDDPLINTQIIHYKPLPYHWFYSKAVVPDRLTWLPMSFIDSNSLDKVYVDNMAEIKKLRETSNESDSDSGGEWVVSVKGGRFDVDLVGQVKRAVYWTETGVSNVRRCLWFYKESNDQRFLPYEEEYSSFLEKEYEKTIKKNLFHKRIDFKRPNSSDSLATNNEEAFVFHSPIIMLHFTQATQLDEFGNLNSDAQRPRVVKRGLYEVVDKVEPDENEKIDHLCFVVHGIGEGCDMKFRPIVDCVDDFREIGCYITQSHLKPLIDAQKINGRVEFLPIAWHEDLHGTQTGIDEHLKPITLPSIPKLREFSNSTILDVLFYTSPIYCQTIINKVGHELNRLKQIFTQRNPNYSGTISLVGHSLGSLICFDLLSNQIDQVIDEQEVGSQVKSGTGTEISIGGSLTDILKRLDLEDLIGVFEKEKICVASLGMLSEKDLIEMGVPIGSRKLLMNEIKTMAFKREKEEYEKKVLTNLNDQPGNESFKNGLAGTGQIMVKYPRLTFKVSKFFALGSPIPMFQTVRGIDKIHTNFKFPTCDEFYNIFHPFDPVAYRFEPLVCPSPVLKPVLMPHHKGRKRMHIELREGLSKVGGDVMKASQDIIKNAWSTFSDTQAFFKKLPLPGAGASMIEDGERVEGRESVVEVSQIGEGITPLAPQPQLSEPDASKCDFGRINKGKRIDYVLQETPFESFNDYIFALASHACYWESEDTLLLIVKQLYGQEDKDIDDANVELNPLTESQRQATSWFTQVAAQAMSSNVQKTISYFQSGLSQSLASALPSTSNQK